MQKVKHPRLNIYISDPKVRSQVKIRAAQADVSISEFCQRAITAYLEKDQNDAGTEKDNPLKAAVAKARQFQARVFRGKRLKVSSADLIRVARKQRNQ